MLAKVNAMSHLGLQAQKVEVEADIYNGLPAFIIVGLANKAVDEAKERVRSALKNSRLQLPPRRITLNLAPADLPKNGSGFDLAMAISLLASSGQIEVPPKDCIFYGELALDGGTRAVAGALATTQAAAEQGFKCIYISKDNALQASLVREIAVYPVTNLFELYQHLLGEKPIKPLKPTTPTQKSSLTTIDMKDIYGQHQAKRAIEIAAAGNHNILLSGPPGGGKTMLAKAIAGILPEPTYQEMLEITRIHGINNAQNNEIITSRPFRSPHHTASDIALIGGGQWPKPGEISLAHRGVLFLDELPEFPRHVLEVLRQPLEDGTVTVSRASASYEFPAHFLLVAAQNPCPCGYDGDATTPCTCSLAQIQRYKTKVSGPLLDRIDLIVQVSKTKHESLLNAPKEESTEDIKARVAQCRSIQSKRFKQNNDSILNNSEMNNASIKQHCVLSEETKKLAEMALQTMQLSARAYMRTLKVSRTIADLEGSDNITPAHFSEALQYRNKPNQ